MSIANYETTILVPVSKARADYDGTVAAVRSVYENEGANFTDFQKWEEKKLAYQIKGEFSAVYFTAYFTADSESISEIERRASLSDVILRQLIITRTDDSLDKIKAQRVKQAEKTVDLDKEDRR